MASNLLRIASRDLLHKAAPLSLQRAAYHGKERIGNRDVVGFGVNGGYNYGDLLDYPFPAIRFKENTSEVMALRQKEKGDWKKLGMEEKKALYRASFCSTFAELNAPTGEWKFITAGVIFGLSLTLWAYTFLKKFVYPPLPSSFSPEAKAAQLQRMIDMEVNPIEGLTSKYDYENNRWKD